MPSFSEQFLGSFTLFVAELDDVSGPEIISDKKIKIVLVFPCLSFEPSSQKKISCDLIVQRNLVGQSVKDRFPGLSMKGDCHEENER